MDLRQPGLTALLLTCLAAPAWAQSSANDILDEIVVTATRMESSVRDVARSISVVGKDRIQGSTQQLGMDEALAAVRALYPESLQLFRRP